MSNERVRPFERGHLQANESVAAAFSERREWGDRVAGTAELFAARMGAPGAAWLEAFFLGTRHDNGPYWRLVVEPETGNVKEAGWSDGARGPTSDTHGRGNYAVEARIIADASGSALPMLNEIEARMVELGITNHADLFAKIRQGYDRDGGEGDIVVLLSGEGKFDARCSRYVYPLGARKSQPDIAKKTLDGDNRPVGFIPQLLLVAAVNELLARVSSKVYRLCFSPNTVLGAALPDWEMDALLSAEQRCLESFVLMMFFRGSVRMALSGVSGPVCCNYLPCEQGPIRECLSCCVELHA